MDGTANGHGCVDLIEPLTLATAGGGTFILGVGRAASSSKAPSMQVELQSAAYNYISCKTFTERSAVAMADHRKLDDALGRNATA